MYLTTYVPNKVSTSSLVGAVYDIRENYDDVFFVIGTIFILSSVIFALIPIIKNYREKHPTNFSEGSNIIRSEHKQTFKISQRSISKGSLAADNGLIEYGSTANTAPRDAAMGSGEPSKMNGHTWTANQH